MTVRYGNSSQEICIAPHLLDLERVEGVGALRQLLRGKVGGLGNLVVRRGHLLVAAQQAPAHAL